MGFGKAFVYALILYIALNFGLSLVVAAVNNVDLAIAFSSAENILLMLFAPAAAGPAAPFVWVGNVIVSFTVGILFTILLLVVPSLLAALVAGKTGEEPKAAFGAWLLVPIICNVISIVLALLMPVYETSFVLSVISWSGVTGILAMTDTAFVVLLVLFGVGTGLMWSGVAALTAGP